MAPREPLAARRRVDQAAVSEREGQNCSRTATKVSISLIWDGAFNPAGLCLPEESFPLRTTLCDDLVLKNIPVIVYQHEGCYGVDK